AQQRPLPGTVADAYATTQGHSGKERRNVFLCDLVIDHDHDRTAARTQIKTKLWLAETVERIEIEGLKIRLWKEETDQCPEHKHHGSGQKRTRHAIFVR